MDQEMVMAWWKDTAPLSHSNIVHLFEHKGMNRTFQFYFKPKRFDLSLQKMIHHVRFVYLILVFLSLYSMPCNSQETVTLRYNVLEGEDGGTHVGDISQDQSSGGPYFYIPSESEYFNLENSGLITTKEPLDRESESQHQIIAISTVTGTSITIQISVSDINDNSPQFPKSVNTVDFSENAAVGDRRTLDSATDPDLNQYSVLGYRIISGNLGETFVIDTITISHPDRADVLQLDLVLNRELDRETVAQYDLVIEAYDGGTPPRNGTLRVHVDVRDINEHPPVFVQDFVEVTILETAQVGDRVVQLNATDRDSGANGVVIYELSPAHNAGELFRIDPQTGEIFVNKELHFEGDGIIELVVTARDNGTSPQEELAFVRIIIENINDQPPTINIIFTNNDGSPKISEAAAVGDFVARISVSDPDGESSLIDVTITGGEGQFDILTRDNIIFLICVAEPLDREEVPYYNLVVRAVDSGGLASEETFTLVVEDVNDNPPVFDSFPYEESKAEDSVNGTLVITVHATDRDAGVNAEVRYSIINYQDDFVDWFKIDPLSGMITTNKMLDRESTEEVIINVMAVDLGQPSLNTTTTVTVIITDVNDNHPRFTAESYNHSVPEDLEEGTCFLQILRKHLTGDSSTSSPQKRILHGKKKVPTKKSAKVDNLSSFRVSTEVQTDDVEASDFCQQFPELLETADEPPVVPGEHTYHMEYPEQMVIATDADDGSFGIVTYSMGFSYGSPTPSQFSIDPDSGNICTTQELDRDGNVQSFQFPVTATDGGGLHSVTNVTIFLLDVNDNAPEFYPESYAVDIYDYSQVGTVVTSVAAEDRDSGRFGMVTYSIISGNHNQAFRINPNTGDITVDGTLDRNQRNVYHLEVSAMDGGGMSSLINAQVTVSIIGPDDPRPVFPITRYAFTIPENSERFSLVGTIEARNSDAGNQSPVQYRIHSGDPNGFFSLHSTTGEITVQSPPDREVQPYVLLNVQAASGNPPSYASAQVNVSIEDINDNAPSFGNFDPFTRILENTPLGSVVFIATATDPDSGTNGEVRYHLVDNPGGTFSINPVTGYIRLQREVDFDQQQQHTIVIRAYDQGVPERDVNLTFIFHIEDFNDNGPQFSADSYRESITELLEIGSRILQVSATDRDAGNNAAITFSLSPSASGAKFGIFPDSGWIYLHHHLDYELERQYILSVVATDNGEEPIRDTAVVYITVLDANDNPPHFEREIYTFTVDENVVVGSEIGTVVASDRDSGDNGDVMYSLSTDGPFEIGSDTGFVTTTSYLDHEIQASYMLEVTATDKGNPQNTATATVFVQVNDLNDNAPFFSRPTIYRASVKEDEQTETVVIQVVAQDADSGSNGNITYSINPGVEEFTINPVTGLIKTARILDRESQSHYSLVVTATDSGSPPKWSSVYVEVKVLDVNDNAPSVDGNFTFTVDESAPPRTVIGTIAAFDSDAGRNGMLYFSIIEGNIYGMFAINRSNGDLLSTMEVDYEVAAHHNLKVLVEDQGSIRPQSVTVFVDINVLDANDNAPTFPLDPVYLAVVENSPPGHVIWTFQAVDPDSGANGEIRYRLVPEQAYFDVDPVSGILMVAQPIDREVVSEFHFTVEAKDQALSSRRLHSSVSVVCIVADENDNTPVFTSRRVVYVMEDEPIGYPVIHITAEDGDAGKNGQIIYQITQGNHEGKFALGPDTGLLTIAHSLDHEHTQKYILNITARDQGIIPKASWQVIEVYAEDVNDQPPMFNQSLYIFNVSEGQLAGTFVGQVNATDADTGVNGELTFEIPEGIANNLFQIDSDTGVVSTREQLDRETRDQFSLTVYVMDGAFPSHYDVATVVVNVVDINDNPPMFATDFYSLAVPEAYHTDVIHVVAAFDPDLRGVESIEYQLAGGNEGNSFRLDPQSGALSIVSSLDRETTPAYNLTIRAVDSSDTRLSSTMVIKVIVLDVNDNDPTFEEPFYQAEIREDTVVGTSVVTVQASDTDDGLNGAIFYSLDEMSGRLFTVDEMTGEVTTAGMFDYEKQTSHTIQVRATDRSSFGPRSEQVQVTVNIIDVNDNAPVFTTSPIRATMTLGTSANTMVANLEAEDKDSGENGQIRYRFAQTSSEFIILGQAVKTRTTLNTENFYRLEVEAYDMGSPILSTTAMLEVWVTNNSTGTINFAAEAYQATVSEDAAPETVVRSVSVTTTYSNMEFSIASGNENGAFKLSSPAEGTATIVIQNSSSLDYENEREIVLIVEAQAPSGRAVPHYGYTTVTISLEDANDNAPQFTQDRYSTFVMEGSELSRFVTQVSATDADEGSNAAVTFHITGGNTNNVFAIDAETGIIMTNGNLDRETQDIYRLTLKARDGGNPRREDTVMMKITINDENDNKPTFPIHEPVRISEGLEIGSVVTRVTADDADINPTITYAFSAGGNPGRMFNVDAYSGTITLAEPLDRERQLMYHLVINASDIVHTDQTTIVVNVLDENDNAPVFTQQSYEVTLPELTPRGQHVLTVNASDADIGDNARIRYSIEVPPAQAFSINEVTGAIYTDQEIQYNVAQPVIQLVITATDQGTPSLSQVVAVRIKVLDVNNNAPVFLTSLYQGTVPENAAEDTIVVTVTASDDDVHFPNQKIDYSIVSGNENQTFFISADSGVITVYNSLDRETREVYTLIVMASDRGNDQKNSTAEVVIQVLDVNDNPPVFSPAEYSGEISESAKVGADVLRVSTFDMDKGENAEVRYDIKSGNTGGYFAVNETSGVISVRSNLDHETVPEVRLIVIATDRGISSLSNTVIVYVNITDENDNRPYFPVMMYLERVAENTPPGVVFTAEAHDKDTGIYGQLKYSIIDGTGQEFFEINPTTGEVSSKRMFDYEEEQSYILIIRATDSGQDSVQVQAQVSITGVDEYAPEFERIAYQFSVNEDAPVGDEVGKVSATDKDSGPDSVILFSFQDDQEHFAIDEVTGVVTVKKKFNHSSQRAKRATDDTFSFIIIASSGKPNSMVARVSAAVKVLPPAGGFPGLVIGLVSVVVLIFLLVVICFLIALIRMRRKEKQPSQDDNLNRSVSPRSYDATFDQHVEMGHGIMNPNITENQMLNMGSYSPRVMYGVPPTNSSMEVGHLTKTDVSDQSHSASSGRGSVTVEDEEIRQINERTVPHQPRDVLDSGIQPDHEDLSYRNSASDMNSPRSKPFSTSVESMHVFGEEGGGEAGGQIGHLIYAHLDEAITDEDIAIVDGANVFGYNNEGQPSMGGSLSSIVNSEEEFSGSYNWDYLLDWGPQFQPLAHVFAEIAKLKDDTFVPKSENRTYPKKAFQPLNKTYPPPLITNVVHGPITQLNHSVTEKNALNQSYMSHSNLPRSPITHDHALIPAAVTPDLSPSLSPLAPGSPSLSPLVTSTGVSSSQSSRRNSGSKSFSSPRTPRGGIIVTVPPHLMNEPEIQI